MTNTNDSTNIDFNEYIYLTILAILKITNDNNKLIDHPFIVFEQNKQQDAFEGCNKWFEVIDIIAHDIYDMFATKMIIQTRCNACNNSRNDNIVTENALSVSIDNMKIKSIQDAINFFQVEELISANCDVQANSEKEDFN